MSSNRLPTYFISHGGGPWPYMKAEMGALYNGLEASLQRLPADIGLPVKAVLMVSAHWEEAEFTAMASPTPPMLYDYSGFPAHTYHIQYRAPGSPELAQRVQRLLGDAGLPAKLDAERGFDHGAFVPMAVMYPQADMPMVQLSLRRGLDPATHVQMGQALAPLRGEGILIVGSGLSYHNLREFYGPGAREPSAAFDAWLRESMAGTSPEARIARLLAWQSAPAARRAHPREEHLLPLMVATGAAGHDEAKLIYHEDNFFGAITVSSFAFGLAPASGGAG